MITKGIIEQVLSPYEVKVRIPILNGIAGSSTSTSVDELNVATICTLPNCLLNLQVGDIVFVGFEDNTYYKAVILGCLLTESTSTTYGELDLNKLNIREEAHLPAQTSIGELSPVDLEHLLNTRENIQKQIDAINEKLDLLSKDNKK